MGELLITHPQLVKALVKNPNDIIDTLSPAKVDLWHGATGVAGECGELLEGIMLPGTTIASVRENVCEEVGDIFFYTEQLIQRTGIILEWDVIDYFAQHRIISPDMALTYAATVAVEGSKVLDTVKKCAIYDKPLDLGMLETQLTEVCKYVVTLCYMYGLDHDEVLKHNIQKLSKRYAGLTYSDQAAQDRADKVIERKPFPGEPATI